MTTTKIINIPACTILSFPLTIQLDSDFSSLDLHFNSREKKEYQRLFHLTHQNPSDALLHVSEFAQIHSHVPMVWNLLAFCHIQLKDLSSHEKLITETYERFPDYLFAKINYADLLLRKGKWRKVPDVLKQMDLSLIEHKTAFHYSEVRGFMTVLSYYYHEAGKRSLALEAFRIAVQADPTHPSVFKLEKKLFHYPLLRFVKYILKRLLSSLK